jgi:glycine/D-amino acid oxidase-like deaminating enzyme
MRRRPRPKWVTRGTLPAIVNAGLAAWRIHAPDADASGALVRAFSRAIEQRGVGIFERSPVPEPLEAARNGGFAVRAGSGTVHAQRVFVAADGALPQLVPGYAASVRTKRLHMVATAPVAERVVPCAIGIRWGFEYLQQRPDGRIAIGGFSDFDGERRPPPRSRASPPVTRASAHPHDSLGIEAPITHR